MSDSPELKKKNLIFLGAPGAGKGTIAHEMAEKYRIAHISTGDILRGEIAAGVERLLLARQALDKSGAAENAAAYFVGLTPEMRIANLAMANQLREAGLKIALELEERSFKAQLRGANKSGAKFAVIRGESEAEKGVAMVKNMADGSQCELPESEIFEYILRNAGETH